MSKRNYVVFRDVNFHINCQQHKGTATTVTSAHNSYYEVMRKVLELNYPHGSGWKDPNLFTLESITCLPIWETESGWHSHYKI